MTMRKALLNEDEDIHMLLIVYSREGTNKLMILNGGPIIEKNDEQTLFDYSGCFHSVNIIYK